MNYYAYNAALKAALAEAGEPETIEPDFDTSPSYTVEESEMPAELARYFGLSS